MLSSGTVLMILTAAMGIADTLIAGLLLGEDAVTGICLVQPIYSLASFFAVACSYGVPILYAGKTGAFRKAEADRCFGVGLTVAAAAGVLMFAAILAGGHAYLNAYGSGGAVHAGAAEYLDWLKYAVLLLPLNELLGGMVFADGDERISLAANLTQGALKAVLSVALCRGMGTKGLAIASLISFAAAILLYALHFFRPGNTLKPNLAFSPAVLREIVRFGIVDASTYLFSSLFTAAVSFFILRRFGPEMLILVSAVTLVKEAQILFEGIGEAITPIISIYLGEETYPGVRKVWKLARWSLWLESVLSTAVLLACAPLIVGMLGIRDPVTAGYAVRGIRMLSLTLIFTCRLFLDSSYFILIERIPLGIFDSLLRDLLPALPLAVLGGLAGGVPGLFAGLAIAQPLGYLLSVLYISRRYGPENYALFIAEAERRKNVKLFEFTVQPDTVVQVRDRIGAALKESACPEAQVNRTMLLFEELFMLIYDCNPGRTVLAECAVDIGDSIRMITKDNGRIVDLTDTDRDVSSLRAYTLSSLLEAKTTQRGHYLALSYNRNVLVIK